MMSQKMATGAAWMFASRVILNSLGFISTVVLARLLVPDDFGVVAIATAVATIVALMTELSLAQSLIRHPDPQSDHFHTAWSLSIIRALILTAIVIVAAFVTPVIYGDERLFSIMLMLAGATFIGGMQNPMVSMPQREMIFTQDVILNIGEKVVGFIVGVGLALYLRNYFALIFSVLASQLIRTILSYALSPYRPRFTLSKWRELLSFSVWVSLSYGLVQINIKSDALFIGRFATTIDVGHYNMGDRVALIGVRELMSPLISTLFPAYSRMQGAPDRMAAAYIRAQGLLICLSFAAGAMLALVADPMVRFFLGDKWLDTVPYLQAIAVLLAMNSMQGARELGMALGASKSVFQRDLAFAIVRIILVVAGMSLAPIWGFGIIAGLLIGRALATIFDIGNNMFLVRRLIMVSLSRQIALAIRPLLAATAMAIMIILLHRYIPFSPGKYGEMAQMAVAGIVGFSTYGAAILVLDRIRPDPNGPQIEIMILAGRLFDQLRRRRRTDSPRTPTDL